MSGYYCYVIHHATEVDAVGDPLVVYVGKGGGRRDRHWCKRNVRVMALVESGLTRPAFRIANGLTEDDAFAEEMRLIALYGRQDIGTGCLLNLTDGGPGALNIARPTLVNRNAKIGAANRGRIISPEARAKISATLTGHKMSPESVARSRAARTGRKLTPERCAQMSAARRGKPKSDEHRAKLSAIKKSPEHMAKCTEAARAANTGRKQPQRSTEWRAKLSAANRGREMSPEWIAKIAAANKGRIPHNKGKKHTAEAEVGR
jgi:NUMOD3 motif